MTEQVLYMAHVLYKYFIIATLNFYYSSYPPTEFPDWCFFLEHNTPLHLRCTVLAVGNIPNAI